MPVTVTSPPVMAPAARNVPASIRSGMTRCAAPWSRSTPSTTSRGEPIPSILAPMATRKRARSATSGSHAAPSMTLRPSATTAAMRTFAVPVTVEPNGPPRYIVAPVSFSARASM